MQQNEHTKKILVCMPRGDMFDTFFDAPLEAQLASLGQVEWNETGRQFTQEELAQRLRGVDICVTGWGNAPFTADTLAHADTLKLIAHTAGTIRPMVGDEVFGKGIRVCSGNRVFARSVAEGVITYLLCALRRVPEYQNAMLAGEWPLPNTTRGLLEKRVGLIGYGMIAEYLATFLRAFDCTVLVSSAHADPEELRARGLIASTAAEIFETCDIVSLHSGMTQKTYHSIGADLLTRMKPGAILVNTARGALMDEQVLADALQSMPIEAVLDVYEQEPLPMDSPLRQCKNVFLMPHTAGPATDRRKDVARYVIQDIACFLQGKPLGCEITQDRAQVMTTTL